MPVSIVRRDLIPKMQAEPDYLTRYKIRIFDPKNNELTPAQVNWFSEEAVNYRFKQDPGDHNSLGSIRINFPSAHGVYMHDTPYKNLFGEDVRFDSSGCMRIQNVRDLVNWLLSETNGLSRIEIDEVIKSGERIDAKLKPQVPLHWIYVTAWATADGVVQFRDDIYNRDGLSQPATRITIIHERRTGAGRARAFRQRVSAARAREPVLVGQSPDGPRDRRPRPAAHDLDAALAARGRDPLSVRARAAAARLAADPRSTSACSSISRCSAAACSARCSSSACSSPPRSTSR